MPWPVTRIRISITRWLPESSYQRLGLTLVVLAMVPVVLNVGSLATLVGLLVLLWAMIGFETWRYAEMRKQLATIISTGVP